MALPTNPQANLPVSPQVNTPQHSITVQGQTVAPTSSPSSIPNQSGQMIKGPPGQTVQEFGKALAGAQIPAANPLKAPGMKVINFGPVGVGKTHALATIPPEYKVRCIFLEPGVDTLGRAFASKGQKIPPHFAWQMVKMQEANLEDFKGMTNKINTYDLESLARLPVNAIYKEKSPAFIRLLGSLEHFTDDRTGEDLGSVESWGNDTILVIETLTALTDAMDRLQCGLRPIRSLPDWQIIQNHIMRLLNMLAQLQCHVIMTGHWEKELNEVTGRMDITLSTAGKKLAPKISRFWSDMILSKREGTTFTWSTTMAGADLKTRHLEFADNITPDYSKMLANWKKYAEAGAA